MSGFIETPRFDDGCAFWAKGGPQYNTTVIVLNSGYEKRNQNWQNARASYDVSPAMFNATGAAAVIAAFRTSKGRTYGFRFKDFNDYDANVGGTGILSDLSVATTSTGNGNGTATLQLYKNYANGGNTEQRIIQKPVSGTVVVFKDGVIVPQGAGAGKCVVDYTTGIVTFGTTFPSSGNVMTWTGQFDVPVRFDTDKLIGGPTGSQDAGGGELYSWDAVPLVELRL